MLELLYTDVDEEHSHCEKVAYGEAGDHCIISLILF